MKLEYTKQPEYLEILIDGRLDANNAQQLDKALEETVQLGEYRLALNMSRISYLSSGCIRMLVKYQQLLNRLGGALRITQPTPMVQNILGLAGIITLFIDDDGKGMDLSGLHHAKDGESHHIIRNISCTIFTQNPARELQCVLDGCPELLAGGTILETPCKSLKCGEGLHALGIGVLGDNPGELKNRCGEYISVAGMAAYQPSDNSSLPDYMYSIGEFQPSIQSAYSLELTGDFSHCIRFDTRDEYAGLSTLLEMLFQHLNTDAFGMVMLANSGGVVGASINTPPIQEGNLFAFPEIKKQLFFTTEPIGVGKMVLTVGVAFRPAPDQLRNFLRPLTNDIDGHFHAALFDNRIFPHGKLDLNRTVAGLIAEQAPLRVLHLINDNRDVNGAGDSRFVSGTIWCGPLGSVIRKHNGVDLEEEEKEKQ